jgi:hypothetical protein
MRRGSEDHRIEEPAVIAKILAHLQAGDTLAPMRLRPESRVPPAHLSD